MNMQEMARQLAENDRKISQLMALQKMASSQDTNSVSFGDIQSRADEALSRHGKRASAPMLGENSLSYRKRLATQVAALTPKWAALPMGLDPTVVSPGAISIKGVKKALSHNISQLS
jgi:hypothetical protein